MRNYQARLSNDNSVPCHQIKAALVLTISNPRFENKELHDFVALEILDDYLALI